MAFLGTLCLILGATLLAGHFSQRMGLPSVIGQLLVGVLLGPALLNWIQPTHFLNQLSEIGVIILMFMAGLESDLGLLKRYFKPGLWVATVGVILPLALVPVTVHYFGFTWPHALFMGVLFTATSVSISVEVLREMQQLNGKEGTTILAAAVVDDILSVLILSFLVSYTGAEPASSHPLGGLVLQLGYFIGVYFVVKWLTPYLMRLAQQLLGSTTIMAFILCLGMAYLADLCGLSAVIGAFFAGIAVGQTNAKKEVDRDIEPLGYACFIPIFFVSIGLKMTFTGFSQVWWFTIVLTLVAILTKLVGGGLGAHWAGFGFASDYMIGAGMISRGEMALIIAQIGFDAKLLHPDYYAATIIAIVLTTVLAPLFLRHAAGYLEKQQPKNAA
ncbi:cation:proton antiporter [Loigolactobacillus bifermentans]|uniref:Na+ H+ antiporter n=1 Tax=Loigolactobacillus bifermentans DSM 20003 TaxID=1423726 RepID=A0A0R1GEG3_9LACO|nr:cation:proton antiporter [Loigolactobacillus bifermentans]KRK32636.1 Na+ H+ antiporter [Loigolactobacillus bifermentans DSM 20003]QGG60302.1 sodium:proton antiporter [Loigolactobacillus bifermentans]